NANPFGRKRTLEPLVIEHGESDAPVAGGFPDPLRRRDVGLAAFWPAGLLGAETSQVEDIVRISVGHPAEIIHRYRPAMALRHKPMHLVLLFIDVVRASRREERRVEE